MSPEVRPIEDRRLLGIGLALVGYACFTVIDSCAKWLTQAFLEGNRQDRRSYASGTAKFFGAESDRMRKRVAELVSKLADF